MADQSPLNYSRTQRIVVLVDLCPLLNFHGRSTNLQSLLSSLRLLLSFPPLSESLFSYKLFFSSLSPLLSSSAVLKLLSKTDLRSPCNPNSLSFDRPSETLGHLIVTLESISDLREPLEFDSVVSKADFVASSIFQLIHEYAWEVEAEQNMLGTSFASGDLDVSSGLVRSNLAVLFSPVCKSLVALGDYIGVDCDGDGILNDSDLFRDGFAKTFGHVASAFCTRNIHISWVDITYELEYDLKGVQSDESSRSLRLFQHGIKTLGWGFCSTSSIVLGSALIPFGLIYPTIGVLSKYSDPVGYRKVNGQLNLKISDVKGRPLQCKCCDLQLLSLNETGDCGQSKTQWEAFDDGRVQLDVRSIHRYDQVRKTENWSSHVVLIRELSEENKRNIENCTSKFFADKVLEVLMKDTSDCITRKSVPIWQILLSYLYRGGYWALVSISKSDGSSCLGMLKPFSINSSLLYFIKGDDSNQMWAHDSDGLNGRNPKDELDRHEANQNALLSTQREERKRKNIKNSQKYSDLSWSSFCKEALSCKQMQLEEAYFSLSGDASKKLKFLKCWMKQVSHISYPSHRRLHQPKQHVDRKEILEERVRVNEESEQPLSSSFRQAEDPVPDDSHTQLSTRALLPESSESFFSSLPEKIEHGLESGVDQAFAQRLVNSSIYL